MYYTNTAGYSIRVLRNLNSEIRKESAEWSQEIGIHKYFLFVLLVQEAQLVSEKCYCNNKTTVISNLPVSLTNCIG